MLHRLFQITGAQGVCPEILFASMSYDPLKAESHAKDDRCTSSLASQASINAVLDKAVVHGLADHPEECLRPLPHVFVGRRIPKTTSMLLVVCMIVAPSLGDVSPSNTLVSASRRNVTTVRFQELECERPLANKRHAAVQETRRLLSSATTINLAAAVRKSLRR